MSGRTQALVSGVVAVLASLVLATHIVVAGLAVASQWAGILGLGLTIAATAFTVMGTIRERRRKDEVPDPSEGPVGTSTNTVTKTTVDGVVVQIGTLEGNLRAGTPDQTRSRRAARTVDPPAAPHADNTVSDSHVEGFVGQVGDMTGDVDIDR